jgi:hypothetical protein
LRFKAFGPGPFDDERLGALVEILVQLDDRVKELEQALTDMIVPPSLPEDL